MCKFVESTVVLNIPRTYTFDQFVAILGDRFGRLSAGTFSINYSLPGHQLCRLENNDDWKVLCSMVGIMGLAHVDIQISVQSDVGAHAIFMHDIMPASAKNVPALTPITGANWRLEMQNQSDLLPTFCAHPEKVLLSAPWANGIKCKGQKFTRGVKDFRTVLSKYSIDHRFEYVYMKKDKEHVTDICLFRDTKSCK